MTSRSCEADRAGFTTRARRVVVGGISSVALATALFAFPVGTPAVAAPALTVAEAKAQIDQLETDAAAIDQDYAGVKEQLDQGHAKLVQKQADVKVQTAKVAKMRLQVGQVALAKFQNRDLDTAAQLFFTEDTQGFLSQISTVEKVSENQNTVLQTFQQEQANLADLEHSSESDLAALGAKEEELQALRTASDKKVAESKAVLAKLTAAERAAIAAADKKAADEAKAAAEQQATDLRARTQQPGTQQPGAQQPGNGDRTTGTSRTGQRDTITGTGRGAKALAFARTQLGKPYRYGAAGPDAYDCSGLTLAAWRTAGVSLSRTSQSQFRDGRAVSRSELQFGDLVFFYSGISHVGLYAGNGTILHSANSRTPVQYTKMSSMPFAGARRPG